jgi:endonuclease G
MAKFRRGHSNHKKGKGTRSLRFILLVGVLLSIFFFLFTYLPKLSESNEANGPNRPKYQDPATEVRGYLPTTHFGNTVHHQYYSLSYSEEHEQAEWVAYELTRDMLNAPKVPRTDWFEQDDAIPTRSAHFEDYRSSGYTKGHLAPAADMAFSTDAMEETFLMSNISPQDRAFNNGVWRELEESTRDWARKNRHLYIVTGPVLTKLFSQKIGRNEVSVPSAYYKVILSAEPGAEKGVGFIIPNTRSERPLNEYMVSIDDVEELTNLDFFKAVLSGQNEKSTEASFDAQQWPFSLARYQKRIDQWNRQGE